LIEDLVRRSTTSDFAKRPWIADSGWPIAYEALVPFYRVAQQYCQLG
jgi:hypothetical protein